MPPSGAMRERLLIQTPAPASFSVSTLTRVGTTATVTTAEAHGFSTGDYVTIAGAVQSYNGKVKITVTSTVAFTFTCTSGLTTPATGIITATYASDAQGGRVVTWRTLDTIPAELVPLRAGERLQLAAVQSDVQLRFRVRARTDLEPKQRAVWTPSWPPNATARTLEIAGVLPVEDGRTWAHLDCSGVGAL